jgi:hypothetical protein
MLRVCPARQHQQLQAQNNGQLVNNDVEQQLVVNLQPGATAQAQAAAIAAILPNPRKWNAAKPNGKLKYKINKIVSRMPKAKLPKK